MFERPGATARAWARAKVKVKCHRHRRFENIAMPD